VIILKNIKKKLLMIPGPTNVPDRVIRAMYKPIISHRGPEFRELYESVTENFKFLFQTKNDVFVFTGSGTGGIECAIGNTVEKGDEVIIPIFGLFSERMNEAITRYGGKTVCLSLKWGQSPKADQIKKIVEENKKAKILAIVYNETSTGATVRDLPKIAKIAEDNDLLFIVDAVSILGGDLLPVDQWGIDICVTASQKCIACPPGLAAFSVSNKAKEVMKRKSIPFYLDILKMSNFSEKKETPFTPAVSLFFALDEALKIIYEEGLENRFKRHQRCSEAFYNAIENMGLSIFPERDVRSKTVIAFKKPDNIEVSEVRKIMAEKYGVIIAGGAGKMKNRIFRIGCMGLVSELETLLTIYALENSLIELGYQMKKGEGVETVRRTFH
jgi:aspartate aminotransferase-like enzyme